jgi:nucleotide-binding universal stress UspA family protein
VPRTAHITALHVITVAPISGRLLQDMAGMLGFEPVVVPPAVEGVWRARGQELLDAFAADCAAAGVECRTVLETGSVLSRVLHHGQAADLVIAGSRGETEALYPGQGGTLERLVKRLSVSALQVPRQGLGFTGITLGYDGSEGARRALRVTARMGDWLKCPIQVVRVLDGRRRDGDPLVEAINYLGEEGLTAAAVQLEGEAQEVLPVVAERAGHDLLVVGFRGRSSLTRLLLGRVTERLLDVRDLALLVAR